MFIAVIMKEGDMRKGGKVGNLGIWGKKQERKQEEEEWGGEEEEEEQEEEGKEASHQPGSPAQPAVLAWPRLLPHMSLLLHSSCILLPHLPGIALDARENSCPHTCPAAKGGPRSVVKDTEALRDVKEATTPLQSPTRASGSHW